MTNDTEWTRERQSFSCTDDVWQRGKSAWAASGDDYLAWTDWLEASLAEAAARTETRMGTLRSAPARIPPGRRDGSATAPARRRRSFTCKPAIWSHARDAWWTERIDYPQLSDWIQAAIAAKAGMPLTAPNPEGGGEPR